MPNQSTNMEGILLEKKRIFELRITENKLICSIHMYEQFSKEKPASAKQPFAKNKGLQNSETKKTQGNGYDLMSEAQKRYLFRLLAEQGLEGVVERVGEWGESVGRVVWGEWGQTYVTH